MLLLFDGGEVCLLSVRLAGVVVLAGGTGMPIEGSGWGVLLDLLLSPSGLVVGLGFGWSVSVCLLRRGVCVSSLLVSTRRRRRRGVGVSSLLDSTRSRRGVGVSSLLVSTRRRRRRGVGVSSLVSPWRSLAAGLASGCGLRRLRVRVGRSVGIAVGVTIGIGAGATIELSLLG
jgi:hypothetical protein